VSLMHSREAEQVGSVRHMAILTDAVRSFLAEPRFAVMATINADGLPQQTVLWYDLDGDEIVMNTARGRQKESNLRRDPRVSLCIADGYRFVTVSGRVRWVEDQGIAQADILKLAIRYDGPASAEEQAKRFRTQTRLTLRLPIDRVLTHGFDEDA
jgi:PPOX class probable F420-dependent enzyme